MKKADFYILADSDEDARRHFLCKLLQRILHANYCVYIYCTDQYSAEKLSDLLWQYSATSFLANKLVTDSHVAPISIGWPEKHQPPHHDVIVNLSEQIPSGAEDFERIAEIVIQQEVSLKGSRERYKKYRDAGFVIKHNDMRSKTNPG